MEYVAVKPRLFRWALERSGRDEKKNVSRFPKLPEWETGEQSPTLKQLEDFAKATYTPVGFFFLSKPPAEQVLIPDFRTIRDECLMGGPSANQLDTLYICQQRQEWYRSFAVSTGVPAASFVGSARITGNVVETASRIREAIGFDIEERRLLSNWTEALRRFVELCDESGGRHTVITHEVPAASKRKVKIPDVCLGMKIKCMSPYEMLRRKRTRFVLGRYGGTAQA